MKHALTIGLAAGLFAAGLALGRSGLLTAPAMDARSPSSASNPARDAPEDLRQSRAAGVSDFMSKPFRFDDLLSRIRALLPMPT